MKLSIITINFRKPSLTIACLKSVYASYRKFFEKNTFEFLIVDNFSEDNSIEIIEEEIKKKQYKNVSLLSHKENNGFGGGNNFGSKKAKGEYILFLNNDTTVSGDGIEKMVEFLDTNPKAGILGGELYNENGTPQVSTGTFYSLVPVLLLLLGFQRFGIIDKTPREITQVDWVKGAFMTIRKNVFEDLHGFDEHIFMYTEDMELCFRAKEKGYEVYFYPTKGIIHKDQGSSTRSFAIVNIYQNLLYFYQKHKSLTEYSLVKLLLQSKALLLILYGKLTKNTYFTQTYEKALKVC